MRANVNEKGWGFDFDFVAADVNRSVSIANYRNEVSRCFSLGLIVPGLTGGRASNLPGGAKQLHMTNQIVT